MDALLVLDGRMVGELRDRFVSLFYDGVRKLGTKDTDTHTHTCYSRMRRRRRRLLTHTMGPFNSYGPTIGEFWKM